MMTELTITQVSGVCAILYTFYQLAQAKAQNASTLADLRARVNTVESQMQNIDRTWTRIERKMNDITTAIARLEERVSALDAKIDRDRER
tara:strand:- start:1371 stop:1640 length:270 start_codon:yes stop_codon:yes gene_type:complete